MNSFDTSFLDDKALFGDLLHEYIHGKSSFRTAKTRQEIRIHIGSFRRWWLEHGQPDLTDETLLARMLHGVQQAKVKTVAVKVIALNHFFSFLVERKLLPINPLGKLRQGYRSIGYRGIIRELQRTGSVSAVIALADHPFSGPLGRSCQGYLDYLAALGRRCDSHRYYLACFERFLRRHNIGTWGQVNRTVIEAWLQERRTRSAYQHRCILLVLEDLFQFLVNEGLVVQSPVPRPGPHRRRSLPPRIFTIEEVRAVLNEAARLLLRGVGQNAFLFPTDSHRTPHLVSDSAFRTLRRIVGRLGLTTPPQTRPPGLHSFRHAFAVHWMEQWLRQGADVQAKLPLLSAFLGHVDAAATQVYLTMTPERLGLIGERFENVAGKGVVQ